MPGLSNEPTHWTMDAQLAEIERSGGDGSLRVTRGKTLELTSLDKLYFPAIGATKGELMRYYAHIAPFILPLIADRPLVLKRSPDGVEGETFYQQKPPARTPPAVRVEPIPGVGADGANEATRRTRAAGRAAKAGESRASDEPDGRGSRGKGAAREARGASSKRAERGTAERRIVGGDLATLLYTIQLGCVSVDPWLSRVGKIDYPDYAILDLDPGPKAAFARVVHTAQLVHGELERLGLRAAIKTSGSRGLHIAVPLPRQTPYDMALALAERVARRVAAENPGAATVARSLADRPSTAVYIDYLQNARGKSVASAYCARAKAGATVSTPLHWWELRDPLDPTAFTIRSVPARVAELGDIWNDAMRPANLRGAVMAAIADD